jgi:3-phenylpropionate/trans-cinnamate dioxygenase ferredoxin reductase subunit
VAGARRHAEVLLVGGGVASARCARRLRRGGFSGSILLVGEEPMAPYNRPPLSKELLAGAVPEDLLLVEPEDWYARKGVELLTGTAVTGLDVEARVARLADGGEVSFETCLLATGAEPVRPPIPGGEHARLLRTAEDANTLRDAALAFLAAGERPRAAVLGGGFIGVEVAASLAGLGVEVTLVERTPMLWAGSLGPTVAAWAGERLRAVGVDVRIGTAAEAIEPDALVVDGERIRAELLVAGVGVRPRTGLAEMAGLPVDDGIVVDAERRAAPGVLAAGDVARVPHPLADGRGLRVEHWHAAREGGEAAALAIVGAPVPAPRAPWVYSEFAGQLLDVVGWAARIEDEVLLGDRAGDRFAVAHLAGGRVVQVAVVNGFVGVDDARRFVEASPSASELGALVPA